MAPLAVAAWLAAKGALAAWREIVFDYLLPLYSRLGRPDRWAFHRWHVWIPLAAGVALSVASALFRRRFTARHAVVTLGLGYGIAQFFGQAKGWEYHLYPLAAFAAVALFAEAGRLLESRGVVVVAFLACVAVSGVDRKSTRLNSSHGYISYAVFCLKKKKQKQLSRPSTH